MSRKDTYCSRLGGIQEGDVCMVEDFPAPLKDIFYCAPVATEALLHEEDTIVLNIDPNEAKKLFPKTIYSERIIKELRDRIRNKQDLCPPWLLLCKPINSSFDEGWAFGRLAEQCIVAHEGRHRIEAAVREGLKNIPIVIKIKDSSYCYR